MVNGKWKMGRSELIAVLVVGVVAVGWGAGPATAPVGAERSFSKELFHVNDPDESVWSIVDYKPEGDSILYVTASHDGEMLLSVLPKNASVDPGVADNVAVAVIKKLRADRAKSGTKVIMATKSEKDSRFAVRVHEKYQVGDKVADELHLYKSVGPRVLMLDVNSVADDSAVVEAEHKAGEDLLLSAKFNRKAFKRDR